MTSTLPKGYCLAEITAHDPAASALSLERAALAAEAGGGRFLIQGGAPELLEGEQAPTHIELVEFESVEAAQAFHRSAQFQEALARRPAAASCHDAILTGNDPAQAGTPAPGGPKGYVYAEVHPTDLQQYMEYPKLSTPVVRQFGGRFLVRGGQPQLLQGERPTGRVVIAEFPSVAQARAFYFSPEYQQAMQWRLKYARSRLILLTGV
jgi:uncharacterized protein (DUF1330 family)